MARYNKDRLIVNASEYYSFLRKGRDVKGIRQFETPFIHNPTVRDRTVLVSKTHIWSYGDRYYKLAADTYGDPAYWWVIAWYNAIPLEADIKTGDILTIPIDLQAVLGVLGVL